MDPEKIEGLWTHLHWLTVLAEQGSFTAAAARLGVSKAAMSQRIAELERAAGVSLVQRTTRSVRFTEAGQQLVDDTRGQYEHIATSFSNVRDQAGVARGLIRVTIPVALGRQQVIPRLSQFLRAHPEVRVQLDLSDRLSSIATEGFDLAIRHSTNAPETHVAWKLCDTRSLIVATRAYLKRRGTPASPWDLTAHDCLSYPRAQSANTWSFEPNTNRKSAASPVTVNISGPVAANNSEALRDAALDDLGIALLPDFTAQAAVRAGKLVVLLPEWRPVGAFAERIYVVRPYASHVPRAVKLFVDYLRGAFTDGFPC
ncbi:MULTISPECIES: LysR family transcriptional regulator [Pandoraea]|uniref:LysR family transcriptional regulator n=1 Tax=Pandoraea communis TaxID=2508297 RepID=A0A5E4RKV4_9BURK|nr:MULTISPECIES: LysR family transcriptional regulator [Pandoraea]EON14720.1 LysR family transcriptional regulator [Pandoraea sp. SD6-2]VVD63745.1 LysR family transcriptional regulator [Pandoraea communis]